MSSQSSFLHRQRGPRVAVTRNTTDFRCPFFSSAGLEEGLRRVYGIFFATSHDSRHEFWYSKLDLWSSRPGNSPVRLDLQVCFETNCSWVQYRMSNITGFLMLRSLLSFSNCTSLQESRFLLPIATFASRSSELAQSNPPRIFRFSI